MIKKIPPAEQDVFFQDCQFDPNIGEGANPEVFLRGRPLKFGWKKRRESRFHRFDGVPEFLTQAKKFIQGAKELLQGHENENEILKILKSGKVK